MYQGYKIALTGTYNAEASRACDPWQPVCWCQLDRNCDQRISTTTNIADDPAYSSASALLWMQSTVAYRHNFLAVRHLSQRLVDRLKNAILYLPHLQLASHVGGDTIGIP